MRGRIIVVDPCDGGARMTAARQEQESGVDRILGKDGALKASSAQPGEASIIIESGIIICPTVQRDFFSCRAEIQKGEGWTIGRLIDYRL